MLISVNLKGKRKADSLLSIYARSLFLTFYIICIITFYHNCNSYGIHIYAYVLVCEEKTAIVISGRLNIFQVSLPTTCPLLFSSEITQLFYKCIYLKENLFESKNKLLDYLLSGINNYFFGPYKRLLNHWFEKIIETNAFWNFFKIVLYM